MCFCFRRVSVVYVILINIDHFYNARATSVRSSAAGFVLRFKASIVCWELKQVWHRGDALARRGAERRETGLAVLGVGLVSVVGPLGVGLGVVSVSLGCVIGVGSRVQTSQMRFPEFSPSPFVFPSSMCFAPSSGLGI